MFGYGTTALIISNEKMNDIMKIIKSLEGSELLITGSSETIKNEVKEQKGGFLSMLLGALGAILLGNLLVSKSKIRAAKGTIRAGEGTVRSGKEPKFNGVYSRNNLPKIKDEAYIINLDEFESIGIHWIALYVNGNNIIYFDRFGVEHISKEIRKFSGDKNIITNIYRIQAYDSTLCRYFCIAFIDFMLKGKSLLDYANFFSPNNYDKNDKIILKYLQ